MERVDVVVTGKRKHCKYTYISLYIGLVQGHPFATPAPPQKGHTTAGVYLMGIHLRNVHSIGECLTSVHLTSVYLMGVHHKMQPFLLSRTPTHGGPREHSSSGSLQIRLCPSRQWSACLRTNPLLLPMYARATSTSMTMTGGLCLGPKQNMKATPKLI